MSNVLGSNLSPQILKNRGVPVKVHALEQGVGGRWSRTYDEASGEPLVEQVWIQLTNDVLASIETHWGSLEDWQKASAAKPFESIGATLAICFDWWKDAAGGTEVPDSRRAGRAMLDGAMEVYTSAVGAAFMLANGIAADRVGKALTDGLEATAKARERLVAQTAEKLQEATDEAVAVEAMEANLREPDASASKAATPTRRKSASSGQRSSNSGVASDDPSTSSGA